MRIFDEWEGIVMLLLAIFLVFAALGTKFKKWFQVDPSRQNSRNTKK